MIGSVLKIRRLEGYASQDCLWFNRIAVSCNLLLPQTQTSLQWSTRRNSSVAVQNLKIRRIKYCYQHLLTALYG